jgi:hypothetical protein
MKTVRERERENNYEKMKVIFFLTKKVNYYFLKKKININIIKKM